MVEFISPDNLVDVYLIEYNDVKDDKNIINELKSKIIPLKYSIMQYILFRYF